MAKSSQAFRTIREVAEWLDVAAHVLRFWESKFSQIKPVKRAGGRRYYRPSDMELVGGIKVLLHDRGLTIRGVQRMIRENGVAAVAALSPPLDLTGVADTIEADASEAWIEDAARDARSTAAPPAPQAAAPDASAPEPAPEPGTEAKPVAIAPEPAPVAAAASAPAPLHQPTLGMDLPLQPAPAPLATPSAPARPSVPAYPKPAQTAAQFPEAIGALAQLGARLAQPARLSPAARTRLRTELVALRDRMRAEPRA